MFVQQRAAAYRSPYSQAAAIVEAMFPVNLGVWSPVSWLPYTVLNGTSASTLDAGRYLSRRVIAAELGDDVRTGFQVQITHLWVRQDGR